MFYITLIPFFHPPFFHFFNIFCIPNIIANTIRICKLKAYEEIIVKAINETLGKKDAFLSTLEDNIAAVISQDNNQTLAEIDKRLEALQIELLKLASNKSDTRMLLMRFTICATRNRKFKRKVLGRVKSENASPI